MRIHHLNCGTFCPHAAPVINGRGSYLESGKMVCHCLLLETERDGLILIDSGFGTADCLEPKRVNSGLKFVARPQMKLEETAISQVRSLGFQVEDVRHIVLTHLDLDHAGGICDFPNARVHVHAQEYQAAFSRSTLLEKRRYVPAQWAHGPNWQTYSEYGDQVLGLQAVQKLEGIDSEVALIPLTGHTRGHSGIAVKYKDQWLLHAGDAYFFHGQIESPPRCPSALRIFQRLIAMDNKSRIENLQRLQELKQEYGEQVHVFSAHDPFEFDNLIMRTSNEAG